MVEVSPPAVPLTMATGSPVAVGLSGPVIVLPMIFTCIVPLSLETFRPLVTLIPPPPERCSVLP